MEGEPWALFIVGSNTSALELNRGLWLSHKRTLSDFSSSITAISSAGDLDSSAWEWWSDKGLEQRRRWHDEGGGSRCILTVMGLLVCPYHTSHYFSAFCLVLLACLGASPPSQVHLVPFLTLKTRAYRTNYSDAHTYRQTNFFFFSFKKNQNIKLVYKTFIN